VAQDLARRAAKAGPSIARDLLAAELSPDRNEKREWLTRARGLLAGAQAPIELLLAEAELARLEHEVLATASPSIDAISSRRPPSSPAVR